MEVSPLTGSTATPPADRWAQYRETLLAHRRQDAADLPRRAADGARDRTRPATTTSADAPAAPASDVDADGRRSWLL